ncbi:8-oxo-dGTP diphosphatase [Streptococcus loxodontisalivarius]|uniref:8-oxo-dGTP diphosphatase n=1 Tax=Streptococcus loxodontisalivarius TaxID=1349415 RepID=A0ABS2PQK0_9STRE|nr:8-oxo-dGTP diphosphatase [Streptococcus loxodontisalivarius]MBM7642318.1 8-oxo-dGTP diphosphatase [Streptococcus loxodontisalivarius]
MSRSQEVILTNMCLIEDGAGRFVMQIRDPERYDWAGAVFPGGHIEEGESLHAAVIREVFEETGLTISNPQLVGIKHFYTRDKVRYLVFLYRSNQFTGELTSSDEGEVRWVTKAELESGQLNLADSMEDMIPVFFDQSLSELYYERDSEDILQRIFF